ncbi:MAG: mechanosensitive ion channel family protein [Steroidobacteraceae bacterium]|jgi:small-conductance mechanosensitive channel|nr:mechanosensitive ion channel family protein [Steroidobacteraceae bacterium]
MVPISEILEQVWLGNSVRAWLFALAAFLVIFTVLPLARGFVLSRRSKLEALGRGAAGVELALLLIGRTSQLFLWVLAVFVAGRFLESPPRIEQASRLLIVLVVWFQAALWGITAVRFALERQQQKLEAAGEAGFRGSIGIAMFVANLVIFSVAILLALDNLGVNITALVAGLGVGGIAIALAVQTILGDLLASLSITLDKPFTVGDVLRIDDVEGRVERIGVKSTRLRSVSGEQVIVANADLLKSRIRNLGRMPEQRALFALPVSYETPPDEVESVTTLVRDAIGSVPGARFEFCVLKALAETALVFEICYFVPDPGGGRYLRVTDAVNRRIHAALADAGVTFANAARTVPLRVPPQEPAAPA